MIKFVLAGKVKALVAKWHIIFNCMLLRPVMLVKVTVLVTLGSPHVLLGFLHKFGNIGGKGGSFLAAGNPHNNIKRWPQLLPIHQLSR